MRSQHIRIPVLEPNIELEIDFAKETLAAQSLKNEKVTKSSMHTITPMNALHRYVKVERAIIVLGMRCPT